MFPESLRSLYALTLHRRGDTAARGRAVARARPPRRSRTPRGRRGGYDGPDGAGRDRRHRGPHRAEALDWLERGYRAGWKDARLLNLDPFFASVRQEPRYRAVVARMTQDVAEMRKRAAAAHPSLFGAGRPRYP